MFSLRHLIRGDLTNVFKMIRGYENINSDILFYMQQGMPRTARRACNAMHA